MLEDVALGLEMAEVLKRGRPLTAAERTQLRWDMEKRIDAARHEESCRRHAEALQLPRMPKGERKNVRRKRRKAYRAVRRVARG